MSSGSPSVRVPPVIDFSKVKPGTAEWDTVKGQVRQALEEYGCFEAVYDDVLELRKPLFGGTEQLFELPLQTKERYVSNRPFHGYSGADAPRVEAVSVDDATIADNIHQGLINLLWPQGNPSFSKTLVSWVEVVSGLEKRIRRMILESFGLEKYMDEHMDFTNYMFRLTKYQRTSEQSLRPHTDQCLISILYQNEVNALEIQTKDGQWVQFKPSSPTSFILLIGESLSVWLNGGLWSPTHRVVMREDKTRYLVSLFAAPKGGYQVKPPQEIVNEQNPLLFKPFDYDQFLDWYQSQVSRGVLVSSLQVYCSASDDQ